MKKLVLFLLIVYAGYSWYSTKEEGKARSYGEPHDEVIMYSLTTCGYCKEKSEQLRSERVKFKEYYVDQDHNARDELNDKLRKAGFQPRSYGTPIFDVRGVMLPNNPEMYLIRKYMQSS
jgi:glutaredoxin